jgi:hypothetical protein
MMTESNKYVDAMAKLLTLTQKGKLRWREGDRSALPSDSADERIDTVYEATHLERRLRLFRRLTPKKEESLNYITVSAFVRSNPTKWVASYVLQILGEQNRPLWTFPSSETLRDLWTAVQYQVSGVDDFVNRLLEDPT